MANQTPDFYVKHPRGQTRIHVGATDTKNSIENYAPCPTELVCNSIANSAPTKNPSDGLWSYNFTRLENIDPTKFQAMVTGICEVCRKCVRER